MAAPVLDGTGQAWAGLAIQGPAARLADDRLDSLVVVLRRHRGDDALTPAHVAR